MKQREELQKRNPMAELANSAFDKCAVIRCWYKKIRGCEGFCREHYRKFSNASTKQ